MFKFIINNKKNTCPIFIEFSNQYWMKAKYDEKDKVAHYENSNGYSFKKTFEEINFMNTITN